MKKQPSNMPYRITAALDFYFKTLWADARIGSECKTLTTLEPLEEKVRDSALNLLNQYFQGEMDFGDVSPTFHEESDDIEKDKEEEKQKNKSGEKIWK